MLFHNLAKKGIRGLRMKLRNQLKLDGMVTEVFAWVPVDNTYKNPNPTDYPGIPIDPNANDDSDPILEQHRVINQNPDGEHATTARLTTKVMLGTHVDGLDIGPQGVSTSDKLRTEYKVIALDKFEHMEKLHIHRPDGALMDLLIVKELVTDDLTQIGYAYTARII